MKKGKNKQKKVESLAAHPHTLILYMMKEFSTRFI
jgi:hypothetical protein